MGGRGSGGGRGGKASAGGGSSEIDKKIEIPHTKADKIKYINENGGSNIHESDSYSAREIDRMFRQVLKGKKMKKIGYEWVVDYSN